MRKGEKVSKSSRFGTWPYYSFECRRDVARLLEEGGTLSAYRANPEFSVGPRKGSYAWKLEREIEKQLDVKHAVACNSGTAALYLALKTVSPIAGGDVITSAFTFSATAAAIRLAGHRPVFADVDLETSCLNFESVSRSVTKNTVAILPVHLFGYGMDLLPYKRFNLPIIEDACQAVGAKLPTGHYAGGFGAASAISFNGGKNVPAGEGGAMLTNDCIVAEHARRIVNHEENFGFPAVGQNLRMPELTACLAWHGMRKVKERNRMRWKLACRLYAKLDSKHIRVPHPSSLFNRHALYVLPFLYLGDRKGFCERLRKKRVEVIEGYIRPPLYEYPAFRSDFGHGVLANTDALSNRALCLLTQVRPPATLKDMDYIAKCMEEADA